MGRKIRPGQLDLTNFDDDFLIPKSGLYAARKRLSCDVIEWDNSAWETLPGGSTIVAPQYRFQPGDYVKLLYPVEKSVAFASCTCPTIYNTLAMVGFCIEVSFGGAEGGILPPQVSSGNYPYFLSTASEITSPASFPRLTDGGTFIFRFFPLGGEWVCTCHRKIMQ